MCRKYPKNYTDNDHFPSPYMQKNKKPQQVQMKIRHRAVCFTEHAGIQFYWTNTQRKSVQHGSKVTVHTCQQLHKEFPEYFAWPRSVYIVLRNHCGCWKAVQSRLEISMRCRVHIFFMQAEKQTQCPAFSVNTGGGCFSCVFHVT